MSEWMCPCSDCQESWRDTLEGHRAKVEAQLEWEKEEVERKRIPPGKAGRRMERGMDEREFRLNRMG